MSNSEIQLVIKLQDEDKLTDYPRRIVENLGATNHLKLQEYVLGQLNSLDGGPSISNLEIHNLKHDPNSNEGSFRLKFQIDRRYCCSDIESCATDYLDFEFIVQDYTITAKSEYFDWSLNN